MNAAWTAVILAGVGTFWLRLSFLMAAGRLVTVPEWFQRILRQIPPAALAALVVPAIVRPGGNLQLLGPEVVAGVAAGLFCWRTKSAGLTLVVGLLTLMLLRELW